MREILKKVKKTALKILWLNTEEEKSYKDNPFKKFRNDFCKYNSKNLFLLSVVMVMLFFACIVGVLTNIIAIQNSKFFIYTITIGIVQLIILFLSKHIEINGCSPTASIILIYLNIIVLYFYLIYVNVKFIEYPSITLIVYIVGVQLFFLIPPLANFLVNFICVIIFIILLRAFKQDIYFWVNTVNAIFALFIGILVSWSFAQSRIKQFHFIKENEVLNKKLIKMTNTDPLTLVSNRRRFNEQYEELYQTCKVLKKDFAFIMLDIDKFKDYNDNYGHLMGDDCLQKIGMVFRSMTKNNVYVYRYGGEEFAVVLMDMPLDKSLKFANDIVDKVKNLNIEHKFAKNREIITISAGISFKPANQEVGQLQIINNADKGLYASKAKGGSIVTLVEENNF